MPKAVRFDEYGGVDVLQVVEVPRPVPGAGQVLVEVKAAAINPGEAAIREGVFAQQWPATFPSGQGSDLAGVVAQLGEGVDRFALGEEVIGFTDNRTSHAELVLVEQQNLTPRPSGVSWEAAGSLYVAGTTAYSAVRAVSIGAGDTLVVSAAAGGVGSIAVQLGRYAGARVIGLASTPNHDWLARHGVTPVSYGPGVYDRVRDASGGRGGTASRPTATRPRQAPTCSPSWPAWSTRASSKSRSPGCFPWPKSARRTGSWRAAIPAARSCSVPEPSRAVANGMRFWR